MTTDDRITPERVRRRWLNLGCDGPKVARELGISRQAVHAMIERVNASNPLVAGECAPDDQLALNRAARLMLASRGVVFRKPEPEAPAL